MGRRVGSNRRSARASGFDVGYGLRGRAGQIFVSGSSHQNIVLDPHADVPEFLGHLVGRTVLTPGPGRENPAGLEPARFSVDLLHAEIVPVRPGAMPAG